MDFRPARAAARRQLFGAGTTDLNGDGRAKFVLGNATGGVANPGVLHMP